jgi:transposase
MTSPEKIQIQTINHLGLIAGIIDDIGIEQIINEIIGFDDRELVTAGQVVKAIILNGLGFVSRPLYLFPLKSPQRVETMAMLMGLCLMVYSLGQRELRRQLREAKTGLKNQLGKLTERPTLRWIFQCFQGIHLVVLSGVKQVVNLTESRRLTLSFFSLSCQKYYSLSG